MKKIIVLCLAFCVWTFGGEAKEIDINKPLLPSSVSVCVFTQNNENSEVFLFKKSMKGHWFKGGTLDVKESRSYKDNGYCVYRDGKANPDKEASKNKLYL